MRIRPHAKAMLRSGAVTWRTPLVRGHENFHGWRRGAASLSVLIHRLLAEE